MSSETPERTGLWAVLKHPFVYEAFHFIIGAHRWRKKFARDVLQVKDGDQVLDIGCGTGALLSSMPKSVRYVGIDQNASYLDYANRQYGDRGKFICASVADLDWGAVGRLNVIFGVGLLHHLDDNTATDLLANVAKHSAGARVVFIDPCFDPRQSALQRLVVSLDRGGRTRSFDDQAAICLRALPGAAAEFRAGYMPFPYSHCIVVQAASTRG